MDRTIIGYHLDDEQQWVAELRCGHSRHVRHEPPFQLRPWVLTAAGRAAMLGSPLDCGLCAQSVVSAAAPAPDPADEGGDPACWAHLLCPECGTVLDGGPHPAHCGSAPPSARNA